MAAHPDTLQHKLSRDAIAIWEAGVDAVKSDKIVASQTEWDGRWLTIQERVWDLSGVQRLIVVGAGKATAGMLAGLVRALQRSGKQTPELIGWVNVPEGGEYLRKAWPAGITVSPARPHGCNEPTQTVVAGTTQILDLVTHAAKRDCVLALISGGGSALLCAPIDGLSLHEKIAVTRDLSTAGANIEHLNSVRRCLSKVKGGGLARACHAKFLITCILSDVLGDPLHFIASGPTIRFPMPSPVEAIKVMDQFLPNQHQCVRQLLVGQCRAKDPSIASSVIEVTDEEIESVMVLGNNATAVDAAGQKAVELGYRYWMQSATQSEPDAEHVGRTLAKQMLLSSQSSQVDCIISGGEPTVRLPEPSIRGSGGRNQQLVLAALLELDRLQASRMIDFALVSGGTDGEDGPTNAAGAMVAPEIMAHAKTLRLDAQSHLDRCDAYSFFEPIGGLIKTGPTNTNVCDLRVGLVRKK